jgi:hypothetical protein
LMKDVWMTTNSVSKQLVWKLRATKSRSVYSQSTWHQMMIVEPFQKTTCHLSFWISESTSEPDSVRIWSVQTAPTLRTVYWERQWEIHTTDHTRGRA